jgi:hypothetical protein
MPARSSHSAAKRRKELDRKRKAQEKLERRQSRRKAADAEVADQPAPQDEIPIEGDGELAPPETD